MNTAHNFQPLFASKSLNPPPRVLASSPPLTKPRKEISDLSPEPLPFFPKPLIPEKYHSAGNPNLIASPFF